jgi:uncharacterized protein (TIGR02118 family)
MIKVSVLYPHKDGGRFDMDYYLAKHMALVRQRLGATLKGMSVEQGIAGGAPNSPAPFAAMGHLLFDTVGAFQSAMASHGAEFMADIPKFTNIEPTIQVSEVKM